MYLSSRHARLISDSCIHELNPRIAQVTLLFLECGTSIRDTITQDACRTGIERVEIRVQGRGLGHGVGLCQVGTVELAKQGWSFERILKHYYHGIDLKRYW